MLVLGVSDDHGEPFIRLQGFQGRPLSPTSQAFDGKTAVASSGESKRGLKRLFIVPGSSRYACALGKPVPGFGGQPRRQLQTLWALGEEVPHAMPALRGGYPLSDTTPEY